MFQGFLLLSVLKGVFMFWDFLSRLFSAPPPPAPKLREPEPKPELTRMPEAEVEALFSIFVGPDEDAARKALSRLSDLQGPQAVLMLKRLIAVFSELSDRKKSLLSAHGSHWSDATCTCKLARHVTSRDVQVFVDLLGGADEKLASLCQVVLQCSRSAEVIATSQKALMNLLKVSSAEVQLRVLGVLRHPGELQKRYQDSSYVLWFNELKQNHVQALGQLLIDTSEVERPEMVCELLELLTILQKGPGGIGDHVRVLTVSSNMEVATRAVKCRVQMLHDVEYSKLLEVFPEFLRSGAEDIVDAACDAVIRCLPKRFEEPKYDYSKLSNIVIKEALENSTKEIPYSVIRLLENLPSPIEGKWAEPIIKAFTESRMGKRSFAELFLRIEANWTDVKYVKGWILLLHQDDVWKNAVEKLEHQHVPEFCATMQKEELASEHEAFFTRMLDRSGHCKFVPHHAGYRPQGRTGYWSPSDSGRVAHGLLSAIVDTPWGEEWMWKRFDEDPGEFHAKPLKLLFKSAKKELLIARTLRLIECVKALEKPSRNVLETILLNRFQFKEPTEKALYVEKLKSLHARLVEVSPHQASEVFSALVDMDPVAAVALSPKAQESKSP